MRVLISIILFFNASLIFGQVDTIAPKLDKHKEYMDFVYSNLKYPMIAIENGIQGRVDFSFQVSSNGCIDSIKIVNTPHKLLSREVIRVLEKTKCKWIPGSIDGVPKRVTMSSYINFNLE